MTFLWIVASVALVAAACTDSADDSSGGTDGDGGDNSEIKVGPEGYGAVITRTQDGVPHIRAADVPNVVFGQGWASAQDHPCDVVDQVIRVTSRRAATFGPGEDDENIESDFGWAALGVADIGAADWAEVDGDERAVMEGFVAGWNASFVDQGPDGIEDWCTGADWMREITAEELYTYTRSVSLLASGAQLIDFIATAQPPGSEPSAEEGANGEGATGSGAGSQADSLASNGWAVGSDRSEGGGGMLIANPHFPWTGQLRFSEVQLTTDDGFDVYGAQLLGLPGVGIGFTEGVAWTHTVSDGDRFTAYDMELAPGDPTSYMMDGEAVPMTSRDITVGVLGDDGTTEEVTRTYWSTEFGPVINFPGVGWTDSATVSYRDANIDNDRLLSQFLAMDSAESLAELQAAQEEYQGIPLFNTIAVDADGTAWYADTAATPNLSPEAIAAFEARLDQGGLTALANESGAVLLEGNTSRDRWVDDPDAPWPGVLPWSKLPSIERTDYVMNANDSYWVPNAEVTIEGEFSPLQGDSGTARSVRTRQNLAVLSDSSAGGPSGDDAKFTLEELMAAALNDEAYTETQWRDGVVADCRARAANGPVQSTEIADRDGGVYVAAGPVDITQACEVLANWDGLYNTDSQGAALWREFTERVDYDQIWATQFDPASPATTPSGYVAGPPAPGSQESASMQALADAVALLTKAGFALDVPLGEIQYDGRTPDQRLPVPGGFGSEGITNAVSDGRDSAATMQEQPEFAELLVEGSELTADGYPIAYGTSFLMAVEYTDDGPQAHTILTYGQVGDPGLPGFIAGVQAFAQKQWKPVAFTAEELADAKGKTVTEVSA